MGKIGLIAGNGRFPILFAQSAKRRGFEVVAVALRGETLSEISEHVDKLYWAGIAQLGRWIKLLKREIVYLIIATKLFGEGDEFPATSTQSVFEFFTINRYFHFKRLAPRGQSTLIILLVDATHRSKNPIPPAFTFRFLAKRPNSPAGQIAKEVYQNK